jgi:hypothetical protein
MEAASATTYNRMKDSLEVEKRTQERFELIVHEQQPLFQLFEIVGEAVLVQHQAACRFLTQCRGVLTANFFLARQRQRQSSCLPRTLSRNSLHSRTQQLIFALLPFHEEKMPLHPLTMPLPRRIYLWVPTTQQNCIPWQIWAINWTIYCLKMIRLQIFQAQGPQYHPGGGVMIYVMAQVLCISVVRGALLVFFT